jgi:hypothetical protein
MKQNILQIILTIVVGLLFIILLKFVIDVKSKSVKEYPYRIRVDSHVWDTKGIDSTVNNKIYFTDSYDKHIVVEGKYVIEER